MGTVIDIAQKRKEKESVEPDPKILEACEELRQYIDTINQAPGEMVNKNGVFVPRTEVMGKITSIKVDGAEIGYRILSDPMRPECTREIFIRFDQPIATIPDREKDPVMLAVYDAFLMEGQGDVEIWPFKFGDSRVKNPGTHDCIRIRQEFMPIYRVATGGPGQFSEKGDIEKLLRGES